MLKTKLPDKAQWGRQLRFILKAKKIKESVMAHHVDMSEINLTKVFEGNGTYEQLAEVEQAIIEIMEEK